MKNSSLGTKLLLAAVTLAILAYFGIQAAYYLGDPFTTTLTYAYQVEEGLDLSGYVVRDEQVLADEAGGLLRRQRGEGERVSAGGVVAAVYADQASLDRENQIDALNLRIEQLRYAQEAALGSEASLRLDTQIIQSLLDYRSSLAASRLYDAETHGTELRALVLKRDYTYSDSTDLSAEIADLTQQVQSLRAQSAASVRRITAPVSGLYSAVVDGYETVLTVDWLEDLTPSDIAAVRADESVHSSVGKLILGDFWYYAASVDARDAESFQEGQTMTLRFVKNTERDLSVTVQSVSEEENGKVAVVFRGKSYLSQLTLLRQQSAQILETAVTGLRIPTEALRAEKITLDKDTGERTTVQQTGVYCMVGTEARFKPVRVLYRGDGFLLVRSTLEDVEGDISESQEKLRLREGDEVILSARDLYDGKIIS